MSCPVSCCCFFHFIWFLWVMIFFNFTGTHFFEFISVCLFLTFPSALGKLFCKIYWSCWWRQKTVIIFVFKFSFWWEEQTIFVINIIVILDKCLLWGCTLPFCWTFYISILGEFIYKLQLKSNAEIVVFFEKLT